MHIVHSNVKLTRTVRHPHEGAGYAYTNDPEMRARHEELAQFRREREAVRKRVGVTVGTGGLLSMADVMPELIYVTDKNNKLLHWVALLAQTVRECSTRTDFSGAVTLPMVGLKPEEVSFGDRHFLASEARYQAAREALEDRELVYVSIDYADPTEIADFGELLRARSQTIEVFNATNVHEHLGVSEGAVTEGYHDAIAALPWAEEYRILAASHMNGIGEMGFDAFTSAEQYRQVTESIPLKLT